MKAVANISKEPEDRNLKAPNTQKWFKKKSLFLGVRRETKAIKTEQNAWVKEKKNPPKQLIIKHYPNHILIAQQTVAGAVVTGLTSHGARSKEIHNVHMIAQIAQDLQFWHEGLPFR